MIRVLVVDDHRVVRAGLETLLDVVAEIELVGSAADGAQAIEMAGTLLPDVVLMDLSMPVMDGVEATRQLKARWPAARVIILTTFDDDEYVFEGLRAGAAGYLLKDVSIQELADAIHAVMAGGVLIEPSMARKVVAEFARMTAPAPKPSQDLDEPLSERELEILRLLAQGMTNREIAQRLYLAEGTVKNYVTNILGKIGARDRTQAALRAQELRLL